MRRRRPGRDGALRGVLNVVLVQPELGFVPGRSNLDTIEALLAKQRLVSSRRDVLVLPEHYDLRVDRAEYEAGVVELARRFGCHVVGGSHHETRDDGAVNSGIAIDPDGNVLSRYEKLRPYAEERSRVRPGDRLGEFAIDGRNFLVLVCADFWFSDLFEKARVLPDVVLVPALSVTRKKSPDYSRALWRHLAVARAYEFGAFVAVSDWAHASELPALSTSGVGGLADPTTTVPERFFTPIDESGVSVFALDFEALDHFRRDRMVRGFFWKKH